MMLHPSVIINADSSETKSKRDAAVAARKGHHALAAANDTKDATRSDRKTEREREKDPLIIWSLWKMQ